MAEPEHARDNEADHQRDQGLRVGVEQIDPARRFRKTARLRQIIGEQRHRNAEDRVAQRLQSAHFEKTDLLQPRSSLTAAGHEALLSAVGLSDIDCHVAE